MFGAVISCNIDWAPPLVKNGYLDRLHNTLSLINPDIDDLAIQERYKNRDINLLKLTKRTNLVSLIANYISHSKTGDPDHPQSLDYKIVVNTYPYVFENNELRELFLCLKEIWQIDSVTRVHLPVSEISPEYIKDRFDRFILYDFDEWLGIHRLKLNECKIPLITCVVPLCFRKGMELQTDDHDAAKWITNAFSHVLDVEFIRLADVSFTIPIEK